MSLLPLLSNIYTNNLCVIHFFSIFNIPVTTFGYFASVFVFILVVGGFYALLEETGFYKKALDKQLAKKKEIEDAKLKNEWGAQIRSYVFDDKRVKDHRTGYQTTDVDSVMNGNLNGFIESYNNWIIEQENNKL